MQKTFEILFALSPFIFIVLLFAFLIITLIKFSHKRLKNYPVYWLVLTLSGLLIIIFVGINGTDNPLLFVGFVASVSGAYKTYTKLKKYK
jgi:hypothetical protein